MKLNSITYSFALGALILAAFPTFARAQSGGQFDLSWSTIAGGGGASSGGQFALNGTIGQPDAGVLTGGNFKLEGGFWSGITLLQTPGAPLLKIKLIGGGMAILSWPVSASGFALEETTNASQGYSWSATPQSVVDTATEHTVTVPANSLVKCYRLKRP
jgi:hypothetical protein